MALPKIVTLWQTHKKSRMVLVCPTATTRTSGRQPRPRRCPFAVIVITSESRASLSHLVEAVAQSFRRSALATGGGCGVADGSVLIGGRTCAGAVSGPCGRDLVAVEL